MSTNYLESSRGCTILGILKARASVWRRYNASFKSMAAGCGRREKWTRAQPSISPSARENERNRKAAQLQPEANHEHRRIGHTVGRRQPGRYGPCAARAAPGKPGKQYLRGARWRGSPGLPLLSRGVCRQIIRVSPQVSTAGFETSQGGWNGSAQTSQE